MAESRSSCSSVSTTPGSQMAAGYLNHFAGDQVRSAGSERADKINPVAVQAMADEGIDSAAEQPNPHSAP